MLLIWKNKGLLVFIYLLVSILGTAIIVGELHRNYGGVFSKIDIYSTFAIAFLITACWTYLTKDDFYKDREGNKKKMDTANEFFWIRMGTWVYIFLAASLVLFGNLLFHYLPTPE